MGQRRGMRLGMRLAGGLGLRLELKVTLLELGCRLMESLVRIISALRRQASRCLESFRGLDALGSTCPTEEL